MKIGTGRDENQIIWPKNNVAPKSGPAMAVAAGPSEPPLSIMELSITDPLCIFSCPPPSPNVQMHETFS